MGSSKKHKDKDKEHKRKRKHRSRSRSKERSERKRHRHRERSRDRTEDGNVEGYAEEEEYYPKELEEFDDSRIRGDSRHSSAVYQPSSASGDLSLSIEETNRIRAKLGLKPLEVNDTKKDSAGGEVTTVDGDVHKPAVSLTQKRETEKVQERIKKAKDKRVLKEKLTKVKTLGESDSDDDAKAWVMKSRKIQKEKEMAEKRAKMLEEMDEEFGIGNLVEEEFQDTKKRYTSKDLRGLKVEHDVDRFKEGKTVILTLQDRGVLDEEGDTLINVNLMDDERADKNKELKKKKPDYNPYDDGDVDEFGMFRPKKVLSKYDEEIDGTKKDKFELGSGGTYDTEQDRQMELIRQQLRNQSQSLDISDKLRVASEYLTEQEMEATKFKKVKKKNRKIRKKQTLKADDLLPLDDQADNFGSRSRGRGMNTEAGEGEEYQDYANGDDYYQAGQNPEAPVGGPIVIDYGHGHVPNRVDTGYNQGYQEGMDVDRQDVKEEPGEDDDILGPDEDLTGVPVEDDAESELHTALTKARKLKQRKDKPTAEKIAQKLLIKQEPDDMEEKDTKANITLNATSEFCRTLGEIPTYGQSGNRDEEKEDLMDFERELMEERKRREEEEEQMSGWNRVEIDETPVNIAGDDQMVLDDEPIVNAGVGAAMELARKKGFFEKEGKKRTGVRKSKNIELEAQVYSIEDKRYDDLDEKFRKRDRYSGGIVSDFKEKDGYKPDIKLEYVDDSGRMLNEKEAFRQLSHRFHGKGSGKKKTEKRSKKLQEDQLMKQMSSTDTPLGTLNMLQEKQKVEKSPYIVLSGNKGLASNTLTKGH